MSSLEDLLRRHQADLEGIVRRFVTDPADRDELRQDIAVAVWRALPRFRGEASERTYVVRIAQNRAISFCVRRARWRAVLADLHDDLQSSSDPAADFDRGSLRQTIGGLMATLPTGQRLALALTAQGFSPAEIADRSGGSPGSVRVALCRARKALRRLLAPLE